MASKPNTEREGKMERNLEDRTKHRTRTAGTMLGSEKAPEGFEGKKLCLKLMSKPVKMLSRTNGLAQELKRTRFLGQGRQHEGGLLRTLLLHCISGIFEFH